MRTIIIGDIHGCIDEAQLLINKVNYNPNQDQLILLGDLINKGPSSLEVLNYALELRAQVIMGNHEWGFIKNAESFDPRSKYFLNLKNQMGDRFSFWLNWMRELPLYIEGPDFIAVHAGVAPNIPLEKNDPYVLTHIRTWDGEGKNLNLSHNPPWFQFYQGPKLMVFGHWAQLGLFQNNHVIGLDSGCVYGKQLSALILPERKVVQVNAKKVYCKIELMS